MEFSTLGNSTCDGLKCTLACVFSWPVIADASWKYSDLQWLRIYNAAVKRGGMLHQYYLSVGAMMAMVGRNDDSQATSNQYLACKRNLQSGLGGSIVDKPLAGKESDELAGRFRYRKAISLTDLMYRCTSNTGGVTNTQYGLDDLKAMASRLWTSTALWQSPKPRSSSRQSKI